MRAKLSNKHLILRPLTPSRQQLIQNSKKITNINPSRLYRTDIKLINML